MDASNLRLLSRLARTDEDHEKLGLFRAYDPSAPPNAQVPDPYYGGPKGFDDVLSMCERAADGLLEELMRRLALGTG